MKNLKETEKRDKGEAVLPSRPMICYACFGKEKTMKNEKIKRNLNPHKSAVLAMTIWGGEYSKQNVGSMDFYDSLTPTRKRMCREVIAKIEAAPGEMEKA